MTLKTFLNLTKDKDWFTRPCVDIRLYSRNPYDLLYPRSTESCHDATIYAEPSKYCLDEYGKWIVKKVYPTDYGRIEIEVQEPKGKR